MNFKDLISESKHKAALHAVAVQERNVQCFTYEFEVHVSTNFEWIFAFIIPLLRHFTIFGQENAQNMSP